MSNTASNSGISFGGLLFIVFLVLKLTGYIDWSWWWIFSPFWIPLGILAIGLIVYWAYLTLTTRRKYTKFK